MRALRRFLIRLNASIMRRRDDERLTEELEEHLALQTAENIRAGLSPVEARRQAVLKFGAVEALKERYRDEERLPSLENLLQDVRYAVRGLRRTPVFTVVAVLTLAIGTGANTAIFSVVDAVLLKPLPYPQSDRLVTPWMVVTRERGSGKVDTWSYPKFQLLRRTTRSLEGVSAFSAQRLSISGVDSSELIEGELVSASYLPLLGIQAAHGRIFTEEEDRSPGAHPVALISDALWRGYFGHAAEVLGQTIRLNQVPLTIIGVLPPGFRGQSGEADVWTPMAMAPVVTNNPSRLTQPQAHWHQVLARVREATTPERIRSDAQTIADALNRELPMGRGAKVGLEVQPLVEAKIDPAIRGAVLILFGAVGVVLLITCVNLAGLLLIRAAGRQKEIAIRQALGADRRTIVRHLLVESMVLAVVGGAFGVVLAVWTTDILASFRPEGTEGIWRNYSAVIRPDTVSLDGLAVLFHFAAAILAGMFFGLVPAVQASRPDLIEALKATRTGATDRFVRIVRPNTRTLLIGGQLALAIVLVSSAGVMLKSFTRLLTSVTGFTSEHVLTAHVTLPAKQYAGREAQFFDELEQRVAAQPGVESVALTGSVPLVREMETTIVGIEKPEFKTTGVHSVSRHFFRVLGIPLRRGRLIDDRDRADASHVAVVNEEFVRRYLGGSDPLGKKISMGLNGWAAGDEMAEIVGVVGDVKYRAAENEVMPQVYLALEQHAQSSMILVARTAGDPSMSVSGIRRAVAALDRNVPVHDVRTMQQVIAQASSRGRFTAMVLGVFALIAVGLAAVGMYGVAAYSSAARGREFALRMALGAKRSEVLRMVLREAGALAVVAAVCGAPAAWAASKLLSGQVYQIEPQDPVLIGGVTALLVVVALAATWIPVRRAVSIDPWTALRYE
jgi:putative ABC transport system permease protein